MRIEVRFRFIDISQYLGITGKCQSIDIGNLLRTSANEQSTVSFGMDFKNGTQIFLAIFPSQVVLFGLRLICELIHFFKRYVNKWK